MDDRAVLIFMRYPERGMVKTRLASMLDDERLVTLYGCFVDDILAAIDSSGWRIHLVFYPPHRHADMISRFGKGYTYVSQRGEGMGGRMKSAFDHCFAATPATSAVLIGTDIPDITVDVIEEAFQSLTDHDAVIGPACDGGYYLIGFKAVTRYTTVFRNIAWGSSAVFDETMGIFRAHGCTVHILPSWRDIDRPEDLQLLIEKNKNTAFRHSKTMRYLSEIGFR